ncbi:hypothetical protein CEXT_713451 [Caerostris extrusa]|uniref:Uncharacterized protein n=1 Tax=Caerostris extrusa TaxID=172846 RepID=A0AAV4PYV1_CAEEX|nr:hypothetical protein CEXT_713451 [Caerostris extrusa]
MPQGRDRKKIVGVKAYKLKRLATDEEEKVQLQKVREEVLCCIESSITSPKEGCDEGKLVSSEFSTSSWPLAVIRFYEERLLCG